MNKMNLDNHIRFYEREIDEIEWEFQEKFETPSILLREKGELFMGRYEGYDTKRGNIFISFKKDEPSLPRINEEFTCFVIRSQFANFTNWGDATYKEMLYGLGEKDVCEIKLIQYMSDEDNSRIKGIFSDADVGFINRSIMRMKLGIGPKEPPLEYLGNLKSYTEKLLNNPNEIINPILECRFHLEKNRKPKVLLEKDNIVDKILLDVDMHGITILQGPPGVGKTHIAGLIISKLMDENKSVLLTALTNKAAVEVCGKDFIKSFLKQGRIFKEALKASEERDYPGIKKLEDIRPISGSTILATYYSYSRCIVNYPYPLFDYIIIEEASQAFLTTIASAKSIGKAIIVIGDSNQIQPIVKQKQPEEIAQNIYTLIKGIETITSSKELSYYRKVESRRLTVRAISYTNLFYENQLLSISENHFENKKEYLGKIQNYIHEGGGPTLLKVNLTGGHKAFEAKDYICNLLKDTNLKKVSVAILAPYRETVGIMQGDIMTELKAYDVVIDTVDRVQGLDVDICFYVIPKGSNNESLQFNRFNVATSRAKLATFIIADANISTTNIGHPLVHEYLKRLDKEYSFIL